MEGKGLQVVQCELFFSTEHHYLGASPDGLLGDERIIEIKCQYTCRYRNITPETVPYIVPGDREEKYKLKKKHYITTKYWVRCTALGENTVI